MKYSLEFCKALCTQNLTGLWKFLSVIALKVAVETKYERIDRYSRGESLTHKSFSQEDTFKTPRSLQCTKIHAVQCNPMKCETNQVNHCHLSGCEAQFLRASLLFLGQG